MGQPWEPHWVAWLERSLDTSQQEHSLGLPLVPPDLVQLVAQSGRQAEQGGQLER